MATRYDVAIIGTGAGGGHPCLVSAKSDAQVVCVDPALERPNVTLLTNARVTRLETSASGREVTRIVVDRHGATETYAADVVVVACGAINSAALLLRSANDKHPRGLANGSDVVGRHYMGHVNWRVWRTRTARSGSGAIRRPPRWTSPARPTSSTTSTSWTRASSRRARR
jgi:choline dehydrogenase-like flavoprotein